MSHEIIIINSLKSHPRTTPAQKAKLDEIEARHRYTLMDRLYIAWLTYRLTGDE